ncbi:hypothetical protein [Frankia sp. CiP3]|uniref:hypothetical protein n=1 Tax=Frankia sp. CiP3 TaxID=2880971 RepID=UPI001EF671EA|nr:hypothetical protein [Frankia sp. CiP3]
MAHDDLTPSETGILLVLLAHGRRISNKELDERWKLSLTGSARQKLNNLKLVESSKEKGHGNVLFHELTDRGWARGRQELAPRRPISSSIKFGYLAAFTEGVERFLIRERMPVSDFFRAEAPWVDVLPADSAVTATTDSGGNGALATATGSARPPDAAPGAMSAADIEAAVRTAYAQLASRPGDWVRLVGVRLLLGDVERETVDRILRGMVRQADVWIVPDEDQKALTAADREAAVRIGEHDSHLLLIGTA